MEVMVRFGMWDEILAEPDNYADYMTGTRAFHHAARAIAYAAKGDPENARKEQAIFLEKAKLVPKEETFGNNTAEDLLALARHMTEGEILIRENKLDAGIAELREAIKLEDALKYDEPPGWLIPGPPFVRRDPHAERPFRRGRASLPRRSRRDCPATAGHFTASRKVCRHRRRTPRKRKRRRQSFKKLWAKADTKITSSCLCQPGKIVSE